ncbi:DUF397 domain-containing protein [Actinomadura graeca]|uniref:DUF397 domain-containing protein n=1 Tax=Actinomadura graeca TaxID=2750812 RepID=A0ABX8QYN7_9ACTN|nr:DUF397 domain-containing protein [Actinomadura graeca]QXJ23299.1 DUF397 domain-containing protein [Actinomadura graeca]
MESGSKAGPCWRKSSHSGGEGGQCVELAVVGDAVAVRDSKNPQGGHLTVRRGVLVALVGQVKAGALDL